MLSYSKAAITYGVLRCSEIPNYKVAVAVQFEKREEAINFIDEVIERYKLEEPQTVVRTLLGMARFTFQNGSTITFIPVSESSKGQRVHLVIADDYIPDDIRYCVLRHIENLEYIRLDSLRNECKNNWENE